MVPKGARTLPIHKPLEELHINVEDDLGKALNSPLRPVRGPAYGSLPLEAVQPILQLHELLYHIVGSVGDEDMLNDADVDADFHHRVQAFVASVVLDHPFLKVEFEFQGEMITGDEGGDDEQQQRVSSANGRCKQVANDE